MARNHGVGEGALAALANALQGKGSKADVPGLSNAAWQAVQEPYRLAFKNSASTVFLVSLAFSGTAVILACFTTNNDKGTENYVAGGLHGAKEEKAYQEEFHEHRRASLSSEAKQ